MLGAFEGSKPPVAVVVVADPTLLLPVPELEVGVAPVDEEVAVDVVAAAPPAPVVFEPLHEQRASVITVARLRTLEGYA